MENGKHKPAAAAPEGDAPLLPLQRRDFLKVLGWGGATASLGACGFTDVESGKSHVYSYVNPQDFNIPGDAVYYASTCTQCSGRCGIQGRIRDGRVLKLEGNPESAVSGGKLCGLGQAGVQHHYNPDRLHTPMLRKGGALQPVTLTEAIAALREHAASTQDGRFGFLTGPVSGHLKVLVDNTVEAFGGNGAYVYYALADTTNRSASKQVLGAEVPRYALDQATLIVSFGSDFLDTGVSPVYYSGRWSHFRRANEGKPRGTLVQIEPRMTLTGANADRWIPIRPGTEGVLALGFANALLAGMKDKSKVPAQIVTVAAAYDKARVLNETGIQGEWFDRVVKLMQSRNPAVVLSGPSAEGHAHGYANAQAILALNWVLGAMGSTVLMPSEQPFPQLAPNGGSTAALRSFTQDLAAGKFDTVFVHDANPVFTAPAFLKFKDAFAKAGFKVVFTQYLDETAKQADLVLPIDSAMEDWGTHVPLVQPEGELQFTVQQPLMNRLYPDGTRSIGDYLLETLKQRRADDYKGFPDYYAYIRTAVIANGKAFQDYKMAYAQLPDSDWHFWTNARSHGVLHLADAKTEKAPTEPAALEIDLASANGAQDGGYPFHLAPMSGRFRDGRHASLPWIQETADSLTTIVWGSWAEVHPSTANRLGLSDGDVIEIASASGSVRVPVYRFPGIHPDVIGVPLGQGHESFGRYASGRGVNPFQMLDPVFDAKTGELAMFATRVKVTKTGDSARIIKDEGWKSGDLTTRGHIETVKTLPASTAKLDSEV